MTTQAEKLQKGIDSLEFRIAALAERLPNESTSRGDTPIATSQQINHYGRSLTILRGILERLNLGAQKATANDLNALPVVKPIPHVWY